MWWIRLWRALFGGKALLDVKVTAAVDGVPVAVRVDAPGVSASTTSPSNGLVAPRADVVSVSPAVPCVEPNPVARDSLAASFVDLLLDSGAQQEIAPNSAEVFILDELERLLAQGVPDRAVPQLPEVATSLLRELADANVSQQTILGYLKRDPVITAEVLKLANSPMFRSGEMRIENPERALLQLGMATLKSIVSAVLMKPMLDIRPIYFRMFGQHLWQHSLDTAQACQHLARYYGQGDPFNAYLVGLTHDVGKLAIFRLLIESFQQVHPDVQPRGAVFAQIVKDRSPLLTRHILKQWGMPDFVQQAVEDQQEGRSLSELSSYAFLLNQANMLAEFRWLLGSLSPSSDAGRALLEKYGIPQVLLATAFPDLGQ